MKKYTIILLFIAAVIIWFLSLNDFFTGKIPIRGDAQSYLEQTLYYAYHMTNGTFPLWNNQWALGVQNNFFLQRIGAINPCYLIIIAALKIGVAPNQAYLLFIAIYHLLSIIGFYLICKELLKSRILAFSGSLILLFSTHSINLFTTYTHLIFVPLVWFFYFLLKFTLAPKKLWLLGMTLCISILLNTYIPIYFLFIFIIFLILYCAFYSATLPSIFKNFFQFSQKNLVTSLVCLIFIICSSVPVLLLKKSGDQKNFVLPNRQDSNSVSALTIPIKNTKQFDSVGNIYFDEQFGNYKDIQLQISFWPITLFILLLLGLITPITRLNSLLLSWGLILTIISSPNLMPVIFKYLYTHIYLLHYIRMLHFFLWFAIAPIFILLALAQFKNLLDVPINTKKDRFFLLIYLSAIATLLFILLLSNHNDLLSPPLTVIFIFGILCLYFLKKKNFSYLLLIIIIIQPIEVFHYLSTNAKQFEYKPILLNFTKNPFVNNSYIFENYYAPQNQFDLVKNITEKSLYKYSKYNFIVYDNVQTAIPGPAAYAQFKNNIDSPINTALIFETNTQTNLDSLNTQKSAQFITQAYPEFKITKWDPMDIQIKTNFPKNKFLVFNDANHANWLAYIDHKKTLIFTANLAFKGVWIPQGEHITQFKYHNPIEQNIYFILLIGNYFLLFILLLSTLGLLTKKENDR
ncbi:MAG: hypothetical protein HQL25_01120 [Candidatus Omnitrophica bacterium]|nr:hypothetical protein [Candidatus Omnitrophota bacterium]